MGSVKRDIDDVVRAAQRQGWRYQKTSSGHHQLYSPNKQDMLNNLGGGK